MHSAVSIVTQSRSHSKTAVLDSEACALAPAMGDPDAPVYQCPFCARHAVQTMPALIEKLVADRCAGEQDAYLQMHDD
jgi:hypothetical protein